MNLFILIASACALVQGVHIGIPPHHLQGYGKAPAMVMVRPADGVVRGQARFETEAKTVTISWSYEYSGSSAGTGFSSQVEAVTYWPTDVAYFGDNKLCVAGKRRNGSTVIEVWTFSTPLDPVSYTSIETGQPIIPRVTVPITAKAEIFDQSVVGMDMVKFMWRNHGSPEQLFVQFADSRDMYVLSADTGVATIVLSATSSEHVPIVPQLAGSYRTASSAEHVVHGFMYMLSADINEAGSDPLVFRDLDKDGDIDDWIIADNWEQQGFGDPNLYIQEF